MNVVQTLKKYALEAAGYVLFLAFLISFATLISVFNDYFNRFYDNDVTFYEGVTDLKNFTYGDLNEFYKKQPVAIAGKVEFFTTHG